MDISLIHAVNTGKITLEEVQKNENGATASKTSKASAKSDKSENANHAGNERSSS